MFMNIVIVDTMMHERWDPNRLLRQIEADVHSTEAALEVAEQRATKSHLMLERLELRKNAMIDHIRATRTQVRRDTD